MKRWLPLWLLLCSVAVMAQQPQSEPATAGKEEPSGNAAEAGEEAVAAEEPEDKEETGAPEESVPDEEFVPEEEISEDYPVPLPSDI